MRGEQDGREPVHELRGTVSDYTIPMVSRDLVFLDLETSALEPDVGEILDFAAVRMSADLQTEKGRVEVQCILRWPERAEATALAINGYTPAAWRHAQPVRLALVEFSALVDETCMMVGQNPSFDWGFLRVEYKRQGLEMPKTKYLLDTAAMAWPLVIAGHLDRISLETLCKRYGVTDGGAHRAMPDVIRTIKVYAKMTGRKAPRFADGYRDRKPEPLAKVAVGEPLAKAGGSEPLAKEPLAKAAEPPREARDTAAECLLCGGPCTCGG